MEVLDIVNNALGKIGGGGDQLNGRAFLANLTGTDKVTTWANAKYPVIRQKVIFDFAAMDCPFRETLKFADLGDAVSAASLPEIGAWQYAFELPDDYFCMVAQRLETPDIRNQKSYQYQTILNKDNDGLLLLTNDLTNADGDSAYVEYCIDQQTTALYSPGFVEAISTMLAAELCPVVGKDLKTRQQLLVEYKELTIADIKRANQSQFNNHSKKVADYSGGRSGMGNSRY